MNYLLSDKYKLLEVDENSTLDEIKKSYRKLCLKYHPDKNTKDDDASKFIEIQKAYVEVVKSKETNINFFIMFWYFVQSLTKDCNVTMNLIVSIEDIYNNKIKKITYNRISNELKKVSEVFYLELCTWQESYHLDNLGDYNVIGKCYGDLILNIKVDFTNYPTLALNNIVDVYELNIVVNINLYEYYFGVCKQISYINNDMIELNYIPYINGDTQIIKEKGLNKDENLRADLFIFYKVDLTKINKNFENEKELLNNLFNI